MRIITTWMYFDPSQLENGERYRPRRRRSRGEEAEPGIGIAWCAGDTATLEPISNLKVFRELPFGVNDFDEDELRRCIDLFLIDGEEFDFYPATISIKNRAVVDYVLKEPFVIELSPPVHFNLKGALTKTNLPVWIGTYMGWSVAPDHSILLFITVPGGIIIVSSAVGLANALSAGLSTSIKRLFRHK